VGAGAGAGVGVGVGVGTAATGALAASPPASSSAISEPCDTLSPALTFISFTTPANGDGTSIVALSVSSVIRLSSALTVSPALTSTSMTSTSLKSPMSGTST